MHDVSTEEFANIGVVMWLPEERRILTEISDRYSRLSNFFEDFNGPHYRNIVKALRSRMEHLTETQDLPTSLERICRLVLPDDPSSFQWSSTMGGAAEDPDGRLIELFTEIVDRHFGRVERNRRGELDISRTVWSRLRTTLSREIREGRLIRDVPIQGRHFDHTFKWAWQNGTQQFLEPISFDYSQGSEVEDKAYAWSARLADLRREMDFRMTGVVAPPREPRLVEKYQEALSILQESPTVRAIIPEQSFEEFVPQIQSDLRAT
jgi:hypothetical protein